MVKVRISSNIRLQRLLSVTHLSPVDMVTRFLPLLQGSLVRRRQKENEH